MDVRVFEPDPDRDPDGTRLSASLEAALAADRWATIRNTLAHALAAVGIPCWCLAVWPDVMHGPWRRVPLGIWGILCALWIYAIAMQRSWTRRSARRSSSRSSIDPR